MNFFLLVLLVVKFSLQSSDSFTSMKSDIKMSYLLGDWAGVKKPVVGLIQGSQVWFRVYLKDNKAVEVIITCSGGNRHHLHPPEYCLTGSGWKIFSKATNSLEFRDSIKHDVGEIELQKGDQRRHFIH